MLNFIYGQFLAKGDIVGKNLRCNVIVELVETYTVVFIFGQRDIDAVGYVKTTILAKCLYAADKFASHTFQP